MFSFGSALSLAGQPVRKPNTIKGPIGESGLFLVNNYIFKRILSSFIGILQGLTLDELTLNVIFSTCRQKTRVELGFSFDTAKYIKGLVKMSSIFSSSIYIKFSVCLCVRYARSNHWVDLDQTLHAGSLPSRASYGGGHQLGRVQKTLQSHGH